MSKKYDYCVFIGRMQPPHKAHINNIRTALDLAKKAIIILGSHRAARNIKNPWTAEEREAMIRACFKPEEQDKLLFARVADHYHNDNVWVTAVQQKVAELTDEYSRIALLGLYKDHTSYYLDLFPQWSKELVAENQIKLNATDVRNIYFDLNGGDLSKIVDQPVIDYINTWKTQNPTVYDKLCEEAVYIDQYKEMWSEAPHPVTFVTTDAVVVKSGHILMVRRKMKYGQGLLALPGGFVDQKQTLIESALRELKEETRIKIPKEVILNSLKDEKVFDYPSRSLRGRTITHAFYFELPPGGPLPHVKGDDDAEKAMWIPITELFSLENEIFEDHLHIVNYFYSKPR